jgi:3-deoxy-7-phosphoheptulonate synthase
MPLGRHTPAIGRFRAEVRGVLSGTDDRLLVIAGPCSIHDPVAAIDYARRLSRLAEHLRDDLLIVMRCYFDKPRTVIGWTGLINDPGLDGSHDIEAGLRIARTVLLEVAAAGLPAGCEWLHPLAAPYLADAVSWGAIGARTVESQVHRQLASGLAMPVGFKNGTDGDVRTAVDACLAARIGHSYLDASPDGAPAVITTEGNQDCHVVLRGGRKGPNYRLDDVTAALGKIGCAGLPRRLVVDCSHGNSGKDHRRQLEVAAVVAAQAAAGERGVVGIMLESFLKAGRQTPGDPATLAYGQSITDSCIGWDATVQVLAVLAEATRARRAAVSGLA